MPDDDNLKEFHAELLDVLAERQTAPTGHPAGQGSGMAAEPYVVCIDGPFGVKTAHGPWSHPDAVALRDRLASEGKGAFVWDLPTWEAWVAMKLDRQMDCPIDEWGEVAMRTRSVGTGLIIHPKQWRGWQPKQQRQEGYQYFFALRAWRRRTGKLVGRRRRNQTMKAGKDPIRLKEEVAVPKSPKGVSLPENTPADLVLVRDCHLAANPVDGCTCSDTCERILAEHGIEARVHYAPDLSGALLYLRPGDVDRARRLLGFLFPFTCLDNDEALPQ